MLSYSLSHQFSVRSPVNRFSLPCSLLQICPPSGSSDWRKEKDKNSGSLLCPLGITTLLIDWEEFPLSEWSTCRLPRCCHCHFHCQETSFRILEPEPEASLDLTQAMLILTFGFWAVQDKDSEGKVEWLFTDHFKLWFFSSSNKCATIYISEFSNRLFVCSVQVS